MPRKFFCNGTIWLPIALIWEKDSGKNSRLLQKTLEYSQLVTWEILFALSSAQDWIFRRGAQTGDHFRSRARTRQEPRCLRALDCHILRQAGGVNRKSSEIQGRGPNLSGCKPELLEIYLDYLTIRKATHVRLAI